MEIKNLHRWVPSKPHYFAWGCSCVVHKDLSGDRVWAIRTARWILEQHRKQSHPYIVTRVEWSADPGNGIDWPRNKWVYDCRMYGYWFRKGTVIPRSIRKLVRRVRKWAGRPRELFIPEPVSLPSVESLLQEGGRK